MAAVLVAQCDTDIFDDGIHSASSIGAPLRLIGVPTEMSDTSLCSTAACVSSTARSRPDLTTAETASSRPSSTTGERPRLIISILPELTSTPMTSWSSSAKQAAETVPT
jgi:hypothetical protein